jgi:hypothetical protein
LQAGGRRFDPDWLHQLYLLRHQSAVNDESHQCVLSVSKFESDVLVAWRRSSKDDNALFKNSEVVLTLMIQAKLILFGIDFSQTNHVAFREPVTYDLRLIEVIWSSE